MTTRTELVSALVKDGGEILATLDPAKVHLLHMAVGISGESAELLAATDPENLLEELGDILFYVEGLCQGLGLSKGDLLGGVAAPICASSTGVTPSLRYKIQIVIFAGDVLDQVKKHVVYNRELKLVDLLLALGWLHHATTNLAAIEGLSDDDIHEHNLRKLGDRYEGLKYSDEAAEARADKC